MFLFSIMSLGNVLKLWPLLLLIKQLIWSVACSIWRVRHFEPVLMVRLVFMSHCYDIINRHLIELLIRIICWVRRAGWIWYLFNLLFLGLLSFFSGRSSWFDFMAWLTRLPLDHFRFLKSVHLLSRRRVSHKRIVVFIQLVEQVNISDLFILHSLDTSNISNMPCVPTWSYLVTF